MKLDERAYPAYWEKRADELGGDRFEQKVAQGSELVPSKYSPAYRKGIENYQKNKIIRENKASQEKGNHEKETLELAREANRIAKETKREMRYTWAAAILVAFLTFVFTFLLEEG